MNFGSVCSGIEAASLAFNPLGVSTAWVSEIADFPCLVLQHHYSSVKNLGNMNNISKLIKDESIPAPDILCGGTPCQSFSLAGLKNGLDDDRGGLTLKFVQIADSINSVRQSNGQEPAVILWENVEGVLKDKTNAFGCFISALAGLDNVLNFKKWSNAGILYGKTRNIAWRILDAKFFGLPQQRRRLFLIATDINLNPEKILFEIIKDKNLISNNLYNDNTVKDLFSKEDIISNIKIISNNKIEVFRNYTDCLYSAYGTKWNGNAAAYNGSLYISQNDKVRRLTPLECERLMGFPDNYTNIHKSKYTNRYQAIGNSWAIPVIKWLAHRICNYKELHENIDWINELSCHQSTKEYKLYLLENNDYIKTKTVTVNCNSFPNSPIKGDIFGIVDIHADAKLYLSFEGAKGILRRKVERNVRMNNRLECLFKNMIEPVSPISAIHSKESYMATNYFHSSCKNDAITL